MSDLGQNDWIWSFDHKRYYRWDWNGQLIWADAPTSDVERPASVRAQVSSQVKPASLHGSSSAKRCQGETIKGEWSAETGESHFEKLDPSFYIRSSSFFKPGQVFAVLFTEAAGQTARSNDNDSSISTVIYAGRVHTQIRRFVVVKARREFCFACPIYTYGNRGTSKPGVNAAEHAIVYTWGYVPTLLKDETGVMKPPIAVVMKDGERPLVKESRINFGIHHPIQYNVKVKDIGYVPETFLPALIGSWNEEQGLDRNEISAGLGGEDRNEPGETLDHFETVRNPRAFLKKGRVFETSDSRLGTARFVVIKSQSTYSVVLPLESFQHPTRPHYGETSNNYADVVPVKSYPSSFPDHNISGTDRLYIKVENANTTLDPTSRINLGAPMTIDHDIRVQNIGRVVGDSVKLLDKSYIDSLNHAQADGAAKMEALDEM